MTLDLQEVSVVIATCGDALWGERAWKTAFPSARGCCRTDWGLDEVIVRHYPAATVAQARNEAASIATRGWLCFLDADDMLAPDYIDRMARGMRYAATVWRPYLEGTVGSHGEWISRTPMKLLAPAVSYVQPNGTRTPPAIPNKGRWPDMNECVIGTLVPRTAFELLGGFRELPSLEDYDLWLRCVKAGMEIVHVEDATYCAGVNPSGGRNADQSIYPQLRREHAAVWEGA